MLNYKTSIETANQDPDQYDKAAISNKKPQQYDNEEIVLRKRRGTFTAQPKLIKSKFQADLIKDEVKLNSSVKIMAKRRKVTETFVPSRKKFQSEGWNYVGNSGSSDNDEFSHIVDPDDQKLIDQIHQEELDAQMKSGKYYTKKPTVYHPVASPSTFHLNDEPLTIYGSMHSATLKGKKGQKEEKVPEGWHSCDDNTPDANDSRLTVQFSPEFGKDETNEDYDVNKESQEITPVIGSNKEITDSLQHIWEDSSKVIELPEAEDCARSFSDNASEKTPLSHSPNFQQQNEDLKRKEHERNVDKFTRDNGLDVQEEICQHMPSIPYGNQPEIEYSDVNPINGEIEESNPLLHQREPKEIPVKSQKYIMEDKQEVTENISNDKESFDKSKPKESQYISTTGDNNSLSSENNEVQQQHNDEEIQSSDGRPEDIQENSNELPIVNETKTQEGNKKIHGIISEHSYSSKRKSLMKETAPPDDHIESIMNSDTGQCNQKDKTVDSQTKITRKFVAGTPNSAQAMNTNKNTTSIQTDVTFQLKTGKKYRWIEVDENDNHAEKGKCQQDEIHGALQNQSSQTSFMPAKKIKFNRKEEVTKTAPSRQSRPRQKIRKPNKVISRRRNSTPKEITDGTESKSRKDDHKEASRQIRRNVQSNEISTTKKACNQLRYPAQIQSTRNLEKAPSKEEKPNTALKKAKKDKSRNAVKPKQMNTKKQVNYKRPQKTSKQDGQMTAVGKFKSAKKRKGNKLAKHTEVSVNDHRQPKPTKDIFDTSDSEEELTDQSFKISVKEEIPERKFPSRQRFQPSRFGLQLPSSEILHKSVIEGTEEEIENYEKRKEDMKKEEKELRARRLDARNTYEDLMINVSTQTENSENVQVCACVRATFQKTNGKDKLNDNDNSKLNDPDKMQSRTSDKNEDGNILQYNEERNEFAENSGQVK